MRAVFPALFAHQTEGQEVGTEAQGKAALPRVRAPTSDPSTCWTANAPRHLARPQLRGYESPEDSRNPLLTSPAERATIPRRGTSRTAPRQGLQRRQGGRQGGVSLAPESCDFLRTAYKSAEVLSARSRTRPSLRCSPSTTATVMNAAAKMPRRRAGAMTVAVTRGQFAQRVRAVPATSSGSGSRPSPEGRLRRRPCAMLAPQGLSCVATAAIATTVDRQRKAHVRRRSLPRS
jgi:hypothetical protein